MIIPEIVAGIDVGGPRKGFHAVALQDGTYLDQFVSHEAAKVASWCRQVGASYISVDAPCRWSNTGRTRPAESELKQEKIGCFSTPSREAAEAHSKNYYGWMLNGADLFKCLETTHPLYAGEFKQLSPLHCFETFPHAVACALEGSIVSAKKKSSIRRALLKRAGMDESRLTNIDQLDAALCALTALYFARNEFRSYGEVLTGLIVVPNRTLPK